MLRLVIECPLSDGSAPEIHRSAVRINHMLAEPVIVLEANAHFAIRLRRRGDSFGPWFGRLKASGDGLRVRSQ
jgi:hypothetical protein